MAFSWHWALIFLAGAIPLMLSSAATTAVLVACSVWALIGPGHAVRALAVSAIVAFANPALVQSAPQAGILFRLTMLCAVIGVLPRIKAKDLEAIWPIWAFSLVAALTSAVVSPALEVSMMKVVTFAVAASTGIVAFRHMRAPLLAKTEAWFITFGIVVIGLSGAALLKPKAAFLLNGVGLQGLFAHPQWLGTFTAPFAAWFLASLLLTRGRPTITHSVVTIGVWAVMFLTQARTAAIAATLGVIVAIATRMLASRQRSQATFAKIAALLILGLATLVTAELATGKISKAVVAFAIKRGHTESIGRAFYESRGGGALRQWQNFVHKPLTGNGFGVYADGRFPHGVTEWEGIPISAPVEKGFVPTAVLEETGFFGALLFAVMMIVIGKRVWRNRDLRWIALFVACLGVNLGEAVILSPGGVNGAILWLLIGLAVAPARQPKQARAIPAADPPSVSEPAAGTDRSPAIPA